MSGLLSSDYALPEGGNGGLYAKFQPGENRFRILGQPVVGYIYWNGKTPVRVKSASEAPSGEKPKHFWQLPVWMDNDIKLLDCDKQSVLKDLFRLDKSADWGNLLEYDIIVSRDGQNMETTYTTNPCPKAPLPDNAKEAWTAFKDTYDPNAVFDGGQESTEEEKLPF